MQDPAPIIPIPAIIPTPQKMAEVILNGQAELGILICGTGIGISIAANRYHGIRAALLYDDFTAEMAKNTIMPTLLFRRPNHVGSGCYPADRNF